MNKGGYNGVKLDLISGIFLNKNIKTARILQCKGYFIFYSSFISTIFKIYL